MRDDGIAEWPYDEQQAADGLLPAGAAERDQVLDLPLRFIPWPYTEIELIKILDTLPASGAAIATRETIFAARWFLFEAYISEKHGILRKADPRSELERISLASKELRDAICAASNETFEHLSRHLSRLAVKPPVRAHDLLGYLSWFERDNRFAFRTLPERERIGAPEKTGEEAPYSTDSGPHGGMRMPCVRRRAAGLPFALPVSIPWPTRGFPKRCVARSGQNEHGKACCGARV